MKKVFLITPGDSSFKNPIIESFSKLGYQVRFYDYRKGDFFVRILRFFPLIGGFERARKLINQRLIQINEEFRPDLVLVNKGEIIPENVTKQLKGKNAILINLFPEYLNYWSMARDLSSYYDIFLVFDYPLLNKLKKIGRKNVYYLPFGSEIVKKSQSKKEYDVSFVGTYRKSRENILAKLKNFDLHIWGDPRWQKSSLSRFFMGNRVSQKEMKDIISRSKVNLNIYFSGFKLDGVALRVFEVTGCGEFLITQYKKSIVELYKEDKEIVCARGVQELIKKIKFYLGNDDLRNKIAEAGYRRAKKDHTWIKRIKTLENIVKKYSSRARIS